MSNNFNFDFWKRNMRDRFDLNRIACEILDSFIYHNPKEAENLIKDIYQSKVYKVDILDEYCEKYDSEKINSLLRQIEFDELTEDEIKIYEIKVSKEAEESEEL